MKLRPKLYVHIVTKVTRGKGDWMRKLLLVSLSVLVLTACGLGEQYVYEGESEHWEASFTASKDGAAVTREFVLTYKGELEELAEIDQLRYSYDAGRFGSETGRDFGGDPPSEKQFTSRDSGNGELLMSGDEVVEVHVRWGDKEETMELRSE